MKTDAATLRHALRLRVQGWSYPDIETITGVARSTVIKHAQLAGHAPRKSGAKPLFTERTKALAVRLFKAEQPMSVISARTGASRDMVRRWALAAGLPTRPTSWRPPR